MKTKFSTIVLFTIMMTQLSACSVPHEKSMEKIPCSMEQLLRIEAQVNSSDGVGHGPDIGSEEWKSAIEFRLGIQNNSAIPKTLNLNWCNTVDSIAKSNLNEISRLNSRQALRPPSFSCAEDNLTTVEKLICQNSELASADLVLDRTYKSALKSASPDARKYLIAEQRGWLKGRDECWKSDKQKSCVNESIKHRTIELQANYKLVSFHGPIFYYCNQNNANEVVVTYFETTPKTAIVERGDKASFMIEKSESEYVGRNESIKAGANYIDLIWGYRAHVERCSKGNSSK